MKKIIILALLSVLLSSTTFAVGSNSSDVIDSNITDSNPIALSGIGVDRLIDELNMEANRIDQNNSWEDIDGITDSTVDIILSTMNFHDTEWMSETELDTYLDARFEIIDRLDKYTQTLPKCDKKTFFENTVSYMRDLMIVD